MRLKSNSWRKLLLAAVSALSVFPAPAVDQASGEFTLPWEVRWGTVALPAGSYTCLVDHGAGETVILRSSTGRSVIVMASSMSTVDPPENSRIVLQHQGREWFVTSMVLGGDGQELHFTPASKRTEVAQDANLHPAKLAALSQP